MKRHIGITLISCLAISLISTLPACTNNDTVYATRVVTIEEAESILYQVINAAKMGNTTKLLNLGCSETMLNLDLDFVGGLSSVPFTHPEIIDSYLLPVTSAGRNKIALGGRVLVLLGIDNLGRAFRTDFLVCWDPYQKCIVVPHPIYWTGMELGHTDVYGLGVTLPTISVQQ
ncbi:MAG: hypothetical protein PHE50_03915 [Dehalococcoidales bacterium]|nr:hypothetical protein [Dehalococcoidales bacterium]